MATVKEQKRLGWWFLAAMIVGKVAVWPGIVLLFIFLLIWNIIPFSEEEETDASP